MRCSWYLDSEGETYEGNKCLGEGNEEYGSGDVVSVELVDGLASFFVKYVCPAAPPRVHHAAHAPHSNTPVFPHPACLPHT